MRIVLRLALLVTIAAILGAGLAFVLAWRQSQIAGSLIRELQWLHLGPGDVQRTRMLIEKYGLRRGTDEPRWSSDPDVYGREFDNAPLARLHLAPYTSLGVAIRVEGNSVDYILIRSDVTCRQSMASGVSIKIFEASPNVSPFELNVNPGGGKPPNIFITMTPEASTQQRMQAFGLDVGCLSRIGGCSGASELLPSLGMQGIDCRSPTY